MRSSTFLGIQTRLVVLLLIIVSFFALGLAYFKHWETSQYNSLLQDKIAQGRVDFERLIDLNSVLFLEFAESPRIINPASLMLIGNRKQAYKKLKAEMANHGVDTV